MHKHLNEQQVCPLPSSLPDRQYQLQPTGSDSTTLFPGKELDEASRPARGQPLSWGSRGNTCHCCHWLKPQCSSLSALMAEALRTLLTKEALTVSSHGSLIARVSGNWGEMGRTRVCPKTEQDRRFLLLGNLSVCSRDLQNKDLHMVILARTGRFRLSFSTP